MSREKLRAYVGQAQQEKGDRKAAASHIKKMVQFNALVIMPITPKLMWLKSGGAGNNRGNTCVRGGVMLTTLIACRC